MGFSIISEHEHHRTLASEPLTGIQPFLRLLWHVKVSVSSLHNKNLSFAQIYCSSPPSLAPCIDQPTPPSFISYSISYSQVVNDRPDSDLPQDCIHLLFRATRSILPMLMMAKSLLRNLRGSFSSGPVLSPWWAISPLVHWSTEDRFSYPKEGSRCITVG